MEYKSNILENLQPDYIQLNSNVYADELTGNVSIGEVQGGTFLDKFMVKATAGNGVNQMVLQHSGNGVAIVGIGQESSHGSLQLRLNSGATQVRLSAINSNYIIPSLGVGGVTSPNAKLHIAGGSSGMFLSNLGDNSAYDSIKMSYTGYNSGTPEFIFTQTSTPGSGIANTWYRFKNTNGVEGTNPNNVANVTIGGKLGIGSSNPGYKLEVDTNGVHDGIKIRGANAPGLTLQDDSSTSTSSILIQSTAVAQGNLRISADENNVATGATIELKVSGSERLRIDSTGDIRFNNYDGTNKTGTPTYILGTDASGNVVKTQQVPGVSGATSLYDLIPNGAFTTTYAFTSTAGTYSEVMSGDDVITLPGTYTVQMYVSDYSVGGTQYREYYSGVMSWNWPDSTNDTGIGAISEIVLHRAGHAGNQGIIYLRTKETGSTGNNELKLEIMCNKTYTGASNVVFKFVRLI
jgi:hypothetical protein